MRKAVIAPLAQTEEPQVLLDVCRPAGRAVNILNITAQSRHHGTLRAEIIQHRTVWIGSD